MKFKSVVLLAICSFFAVSCTSKQRVQETAPSDFVTVTLGGAAEKAHNELAMLAKLRGQGIEPLLAPPEPALARPVSISWTGPAEGALKEICLKVGYQFRLIGNPSAQALVVVVQGSDRSAYTVLSDIAWQVQPQAVVQVDPIGRIITLARTVGARS